MALIENQLDEEIINSITHGLGTILSIIGTIFLIIHTAYYCNTFQVIGSAVYGITLIMLYGASTIYHGTPDPVKKERLKILDHACIYLLIAGTYTPFMLITLNNTFGFSILAFVWLMALAGVIFKLFFYTQKLKFISTMLYLLMSWMALIAVKPLIAGLPFYGFLWLIIGGFSYTLGTIFYLKDHNRFYHAVWHLFVITGSICHFISIFFYVIQSSNVL